MSAYDFILLSPFFLFLVLFYYRLIKATFF